MSTSSTLDNEAAVADKKPHRPAPAPAKKKRLHPALERYKKPAMIAGGIIALIACVFYAYDACTHEETDDAYVTGHLHNISSRIAGQVTGVFVDDNQYVHAGDKLVTLDPSDYVALATAAKANLDVAEANLARLQSLVDSHAIAPEDVDRAKGTRDTDLAQYALAQLQIQYSTITAPSDGYVGRKNVEVGNRVSAGQTMLVIVEPDLWVVANFKETQLAHMQPGQPVTIAIDSIPGHIFTGQVDSFSPATGNQFALLPADNSTGNFTKIVQRIPVKITFNKDSIHGFADRIRAGESAVVKVALTEPEKVAAK